MFGLPNAPQKVLKDQYRVIAHVGAITFIGETAQVFFLRKLISFNPSIAPKTEYWVATITFRHDKLPEKASDLELDSTGFRVTSYVVDRDWTRSPDPVASSSASSSVSVGSAPVAQAGPQALTGQSSLPVPGTAARGGAQ
jgi:type IV secretion system protein VirB8